MFGANSHITAKKFPEFGHNQVKLFPNFNMSIIGLHINVVEYNCPLSTWLCCLILALMEYKHEYIYSQAGLRPDKLGSRG